MGFRLTPIFIKSEIPKSDKEILDTFGLSNLKKGKMVDFYDTNKQWENVFIGTKENCKILCNGELANKAFEDENLFLNLENTEITSIIWNETSDEFGFSLIKDGKIIRKIMVSDGEFKYDYGNPIPEESEIKDDETYVYKIYESGEEEFNKMGTWSMLFINKRNRNKK